MVTIATADTYLKKRLMVQKSADIKSSNMVLDPDEINHQIKFTLKLGMREGECLTDF
jgi:hypothetical protein